MQFDDGLQGEQRRDLGSDVGDFVVYRADNVYSFQLASAVDDGELGITDVVRGADLLESSARQIHVQHLLCLAVPRYVHLPVAVDRNGNKLSKQTKAAAVDATRPVAVLRAVLEFLNQRAPAELDGSVESITVAELWRHAVASWDLHRVGGRLQAAVPS